MPGCSGACTGGFAQDGALITVFPVAAPRFSISNDLKFDAERDLKDIDAANIPVHALNKVGPSRNTEAGKSNFLFFFSPCLQETGFLRSKSQNWMCVLGCRLSMETQLPQKESCLLPTLR